MMKNVLVFVVLLLSASILFAQPTLTSVGCSAVVGDEFTVNRGSYVEPGNSGTNQTWDITGISISNTANLSVVSPSTTPNGSLFPTASVAYTDSESDAVSYTRQTSSALENLGATGNSTIFVYSDPEEILHFPFSYNDSFSDEWASTFESGGYTFYRTGTSTLTVDGYGTIITPEGAVEDVVRIHFVQDYQDSVWVGMPYIITYYNDEYMWYKNGVHYPIAYTYELTSSQGSTTATAGYLGGVSEKVEDVANTFNIYPNPVNDILNIGLPLNSIVSEMRLINTMGQIVCEKSINCFETQSASIKLETATIKGGVYFVQLISDGKIIYSQQVVKVSNN